MDGLVEDIYAKFEELNDVMMIDLQSHSACAKWNIFCQQFRNTQGDTD
jgi:hypothetical protein